jgi:hypothetical protein
MQGNSVLLLGESGVGKTHYGAQLLKRLIKGDGLLRMNGAATNLEPFEAALESLNEGKAAGHTATTTYVESVWPIVDRQGRAAELVWPDYGGEQIRNIIASRRLPSTWRSRVLASRAWLLMIRLQQTRVGDDIFSRPLADLRGASVENHEVQISDQARLLELLQMLMYVGGATADRSLDRPRLGILLTCWDELAFDGKPFDALQDRLPMLSSFVRANWPDVLVLGLSALERSLSPRERDIEYVSRGPEHFGYIVQPDGSRSSDLTLPIKLIVEDLV